MLLSMDSDFHRIASRFAPPRINLRDGRILDDYGRDDCAAIPITHTSVDDVLEIELQYYQDVFTFLEAPDLLFYSFAILQKCKTSVDPHYLSSFFYAMDYRWPDVVNIISTEEAIMILEEIHSISVMFPDSIDWPLFSNLHLSNPRNHGP